MLRRLFLHYVGNFSLSNDIKKYEFEIPIFLKISKKEINSQQITARGFALNPTCNMQ